MHRPTASLTVAILSLLLGSGCSDGVALATSTASASIGSASASSGEGTGTAESGTAEGTASADTTIDPDSSSDDSSTDDSSTDDSSTDGTTGDPPNAGGRSQSQLVNVGGRMSSPGFDMIHTLGQPSQLQSSHSSTHYRLQGGLVGANGNPP